MGSDAGQPGGRWTYRETARVLEGHRQPMYCGAFNHFSHELGDLLATVGGHRATSYQCQPGGAMDVLQAFCNADPNEEFFACCWTIDAAGSGAPLLLLAGKLGQLLAVNAGTGVLEACLEGHGSAINDVAVHPTRPQLVATASRDHSLRLWNLRTRCCVLVFQGEGGHRNEVLTLSWKAGPDSLLASGGMDSHIKLWCLKQHESTLAASDEWKAGGPASFPTAHVTMPAFSTERVHWNYVDCLRWLGDCLLSKSVDGRIVRWRPDRSSKEREEAGDVRLVQELHLEGCANVWWLRFGLDFWCSMLACGNSSGKVLLFDPHALQSQPRAKLKPQRSNAKGDQGQLVRQTAVSYDGSIVVACHDDGSLTRYDRVAGGGEAGSPQQQESGDGSGDDISRGDSSGEEEEVE